MLLFPPPPQCYHTHSFILFYIGDVCNDSVIKIVIVLMIMMLIIMIIIIK